MKRLRKSRNQFVFKQICTKYCFIEAMKKRYQNNMRSLSLGSIKILIKHEFLITSVAGSAIAIYRKFFVENKRMKGHAAARI